MRRLLILVVLLLTLAGGGWLSLAKIERSAVYPFDPTRVSPAAAGLGVMRETTLKSLGQSLVVWVAPPQEDQPVILYFHGNAGNLAMRATRFRQFIKRGYGVIAPAYRGSSGSTGHPSETALSRDARQIWRQLDHLLPGTPADRVIVYGESLGTGVALKLLATPDIPPPAAVVLEAPFTSLPEVVRHVYPQMIPLIPRMKNIWHSAEHARALRVPLLILHGTEDQLIPIAQGRKVLANAGSSQKQLVAVSGAGHVDIWQYSELAALWNFLESN